MKNPVIQVKDVSFSYNDFDDVVLNIDYFESLMNDRVFIEGASGEGKSTFLNLIIGLLAAQRGSITVSGKQLDLLSQIETDRVRADHIGIIFQQFNLVPYLSARENIRMPCLFSKKRKRSAMISVNCLDDEVRRLCQRLDLPENLLNKNVQYLSIGQQQRVAIARALIGQPKLIIADEPTSALDHEHKQQFMTMLMEECSKYDCSVIMVSHDQRFKHHFNRHYILKGSQLIEQDIL